MKTKQKKVAGFAAVLVLVCLGILAGFALSHFLQVTDESTETTELVVSYPNSLTVDVASQIFTAGSNDHFLNVSMLNNEPASEFNLYVLMVFPGNITAGDITLSAESGIVLDNWNICPAFSASQVNLTAVEFLVPWYVPGTDCPNGNTVYIRTSISFASWNIVGGTISLSLWMEDGN